MTSGEWFSLGMGVVGGLALLLLGMDFLTQAMKALAGDSLRKILANLTRNRFAGVLTGALATAAVQSSSVTTVLLVGFVSAGLMSLPQSISVIMGANIGSTVTAQIFAFKVTQYGLLMLAAGFLIQVIAGKESRGGLYGSILLGLGLVFFGMELMSDATRPLRDFEPFIQTMRDMKNPLLGVFIGAAFTAIVQSSAATTGIVIVLAGQGLMSLEAGIAIAFGANVGTCATALLASIGKPREAVQVALAHIAFNVAGVLIWVAFIPQFAELIRAISPAAEALSGQAKLAAETPRQVANAHTLFNVANTVLFIGLAGPLATLIQRILPPCHKEHQQNSVEPLYLQDYYLHVPSAALQQIRLELGRFGKCVLKFVQQSPEIILNGKEADLARLQQHDDLIDAYHRAIITYAGKLSQQSLTAEQSRELHDSIMIANYFENIGDTIETHMVSLARERLGCKACFPREIHAEMLKLFSEAAERIALTVKAITEGDEAAANRVIESKSDIRGHASKLGEQILNSLDSSDSIELVRIGNDLVEQNWRLAYFSRRICKLILPWASYSVPPRVA